MSTRSFTWPNAEYENAAPTANITPPMARYTARPVASHSITTKRAKKSIELPRSRSAVITTSENAHASTIGPSTLTQPRQLGVQPGDEHIADAVEEPGQREQDRIGVGRVPAKGDVGQAEEADDDSEERPDVGWQRCRLAEAGQRVRRDHEHSHQEHEP